MGYANLRHRSNRKPAYSQNPVSKRTLVLVCVGLLTVIAVGTLVFSCLNDDGTGQKKVAERNFCERPNADTSADTDRTRHSRPTKSSVRAQPTMGEISSESELQVVSKRQKEERTKTVIDEETPIELPLLDMQKWYDIDRNRDVTRVKKNRLFQELIDEALPARYLTSKIAGLERYVATEKTSFFWAPFPDGVSYVVQEVKEFEDSLDVRLKIKDKYEKERVKDVYTVPTHEKKYNSDGRLSVRFKTDYFSVCVFRSNPQYASMSNLNKGDVVISRDWGNLFVITEGSNGVIGFPVDEKMVSCDMRAAILQAIKVISIRFAREQGGW